MDFIDIKEDFTIEMNVLWEFIDAFRLSSSILLPIKISNSTDNYILSYWFRFKLDYPFQQFIMSISM